MTKEKQEKKLNRISVSVYDDEMEAVKEKTGLKEVNHKTVREYIGLTPTRSKIGVKSQINAKIKEMSEEDREKLLTTLGE